jgi:hypothetical protein
VKEAIMTNINDSVQEFNFKFSRTSIDEASFFAMRRLLVILRKCSDNFDVCFDIVSVFATAIDLPDKNLQYPNTLQYSAVLDDQIKAKFKILLDEYRKMIDQSLSRSKDLGDMLRILPGVVVQKHMNIQGMTDLYKIKPDLLERFINFFFEKSSPSHYILDNYLSGFLQDRDRSKHYYCDPILQHISICRHFLSLLDGSNAFDLQS